jgi:ATP-binding cassette subfamily B protein
VQGTSVNALRTSILFLMLYLIFAREITVGQFFSLWITGSSSSDHQG